MNKMLFILQCVIIVFARVTVIIERSKSIVQKSQILPARFPKFYIFISVQQTFQLPRFYWGSPGFWYAVAVSWIESNCSGF